MREFILSMLEVPPILMEIYSFDKRLFVNNKTYPHLLIMSEISN